ncbi:MAG: class I SAM-dependent methyltransferase [Methylococcus sp.]|nr:MAG: class I SAM-dependent methyltransferase [Methylococcus sp.]
MTLHTTLAKTSEDIRAFFDAIAPTYADAHGQPNRALRDRLALIESLLPGTRRDTLVEIGCGTGLHLFPLAESYQNVIGTDLSPAMIARAEAIRRYHTQTPNIQLRVDPAECLATVANDAADAVLCVGALEHMPNKARVLKQVYRILKPGGAFVCLMPNGDYIWYRWLAPGLGLSIRHLSTDRFLGEAELFTLLSGSDLVLDRLQPWTFIPRGDMPAGWARVLQFVDKGGRLTGRTSWRGGLAFRAIKPPVSARPDRSDE